VPDTRIVHDGLQGLSDAHAGIAGDGISIAPAPMACAVSIIARKGMAQNLAAAMLEGYGLALPMAPHATTNGELTLVWAGYQHWLLLATTGAGDGFESAARDKLGTTAAVSNQSDNRVRLHITGDNARDVLARGVPIDLHPSVFKPGDAAQTVYDHIGIHLWLALDGHAFEALVARSYAPSLMAALARATVPRPNGERARGGHAH
jgi:sarcosine oxidase subunit gamma